MSLDLSLSGSPCKDSQGGGAAPNPRKQRQERAGPFISRYCSEMLTVLIAGHPGKSSCLLAKLFAVR